jgi:hypothetical protein
VEIVAAREAGAGINGALLGALTKLLWRAGLRINGALTHRAPPGPRAGSVLVR